MPNVIELREINKLIKEKFFIPAYQRGYRWGEQQVLDLLNDIYEFKENANVQNGEFYCLQPIVVKQREDNSYEVVDGQQRLTTILIIHKCLEKRTFSIEYESRPGSAEFLKNISEYAADGSQEKYDNIDYFFMAKAFNTISNWFDHIEEEKEEYSIRDEFNTFLLRYSKVIWYEVESDASVEEIFTRLNIGKIPLTNAELIKALFLRSSNFESVGDAAYLKQLEIASEWDNIENSLRDNRLWYFINPKYPRTLDTRIEYIFDLVADKPERADQFFTFYFFSDQIEKSDIAVIWKRVKDTFRIIQEWYNDQTLFHYIGFLTSSNSRITVHELSKDYFLNGYKKNEYLAHIKELISSYFNGVEIEELSYEDSRDQKIIKDILLLFNVLTVMEKGNSYSRFPFDSYNLNKWTLEHIHAQNSDGISNKKEAWKEWIDEHLKSFRELPSERYGPVVEKLETVDLKTLTRQEFEDLFSEIAQMISPDYGNDLNGLENLALLDGKTNSRIGNSFFDVKRRIIVEMDKAGEFIPVCTRNVFLKYYSTEANQLHYWSEGDRASYLQAIKTTIQEFVDAEDE